MEEQKNDQIAIEFHHTKLVEDKNGVPKWHAVLVKGTPQDIDNTKKALNGSAGAFNRASSGFKARGGIFTVNLEQALEQALHMEDAGKPEHAAVFKKAAEHIQNRMASKNPGISSHSSLPSSKHG